jgi:rsbT co-antagonist protein RsbR
MSPCDPCLLERESAADMPLDAFQEALFACGECPLVSGEGAPPAVRLLVRKQREAARALRKQRNEAAKLRAELEDLSNAAKVYEHRVARLESLHRASVQELEAQVALAREQEQALRELSAPILRLSRGVLALPVIGRVDGARADVMMSKLLAELSERQARHAILDLTGVEAIDAETADHLLRILSAARLLGAEVLLTGLRGEVARMLVGLDFDPARVTTLSTVEEALRRCMSRARI